MHFAKKVRPWRSAQSLASDDIRYQAFLELKITIIIKADLPSIYLEERYNPCISVGDMTFDVYRARRTVGSDKS